MNKYLVIIEKGEDSFGAYSPDLLGASPWATPRRMPSVAC